MANILVVDDDGHIREVVRFALEQAGHEVNEAADGEAALATFAAEPADLVVLDIVMPGEDGLTVCKTIRKDSEVPIIFLSSRDEELDRILGLELGADDYMTKPFSPRELVARVKVILRRVEKTEPEASEVVEQGPLRMDVGRHKCTWDQQEITLTVTEFALLHCLASGPGKVFSREELVSKAYGHGHFITDRTVDSHIRRIRKKLGTLEADPIETVYGLGYRLREALA